MRIQQREDFMSELYQSVSHPKCDYKYHVVFVPKRRKAIFGQTRRQLGQIFRAQANQKKCQIVEGTSCQTMCIWASRFPPKHPVASVIGLLKAKSANSDSSAVRRICLLSSSLRRGPPSAPAVNDDVPWPQRRRAYSWRIGTFAPADYKVLCRGLLSNCKNITVAL